MIRELYRDLGLFTKQDLSEFRKYFNRCYDIKKITDLMSDKQTSTQTNLRLQRRL